MSIGRPACLILAILSGCLSACAPVRVQAPQQRPGETLTVLLPDAGSSSAGRATVSNASGATDLAAPFDSAVVLTSRPPSPATRMSEEEVRQIFGDVLAALPPAPQQFTLYFRFESDELTDDSRAMVPRILQAIQERPVPELLIVGHTDTTGGAGANFGLGRRRADMVRVFLAGAGLDGASIEVTSHGESDPLVPTADEVLEPRNRRVDISVR